MLFPYVRPAAAKVDMTTFLTPNRHGYNVRFSPFDPDRLVVASSQFYGLAGGGTLFVLRITPGDAGSGALVEARTAIGWSDGLFDVSWSEQHPDVVVTAAGDGGLQLWNIGSGCDDANDSDAVAVTVPKLCYREHTKEVYSIDWSQTRDSPMMLSASWDCTVKLWDPQRMASLCTYRGHSELVYSAKFAPHMPGMFASVGGDGLLKLWSAQSGLRPVAGVKAHDAEVLCVDWCHFDNNLLATGGSDGLIRGWDVRQMRTSCFELRGCKYAVRRIKFSPFARSTLASVAYDSTTRLWDHGRGAEAIETLRHHSEFAYGLDWNRLRTNQLADCGWDSLVHVFTPKSLVATGV